MSSSWLPRHPWSEHTRFFSALTMDLLATTCHHHGRWCQLCRKYNIRRVRLNEPKLDVVEAFPGMGIDLSFGVSNSLITNMATNHTIPTSHPSSAISPSTTSLLLVTESLQNLLNARYLGQVKTTTLVGLSSLAVKTPPSSGAFDTPPFPRT